VLLYRERGNTPCVRGLFFVSPPWLIDELTEVREAKHGCACSDLERISHGGFCEENALAFYVLSVSKVAMVRICTNFIIFCYNKHLLAHSVDLQRLETVGLDAPQTAEYLSIKVMRKLFELQVELLAHEVF